MHASALFPIRKVALVCAVIVCSCIFFSNQSHAQGNNADVTNGGTEFLLCFMANVDANYEQNDSRYQDIYLASQNDSAIVTITCKAFPNWSKVIQLAPEQGISYRLSKDPDIYKGNAILESVETIDNTVFKVISTSPIICYGMNHKSLSCDAFLALPRNVASTEYLVMSYANSSLTGMEMPSEFSVAAFDSNTVVTIIPATITASGSPAGKPLTFILDAGQGLQIQADKHTPMLDLTGSIVRSTKPVVVYGGHKRVEVPVGFYNYSNGGLLTSRDHLCEAMPPLSAWGNAFIAKNFGREGGDLMRVLSSMDSTIVKINGQVWGEPLMARQYRDTMIALSNVAADNIFGVETSNPSLVGMIAHTEVTGSNGDPFLAIIPPLDQTYDDYTYFISDDNKNFDLNTQYIIVATEASGAGAITIDGATLSKLAYTNVPILLNGKQYSVSTITQTPGIHKAVSPNSDENGFTILAYGFGPLDSYGYTAGALVKPIKGIIPIDLSANPDGKITLRNILAEQVILDSGSIRYSHNSSEIVVSLKKDIAHTIINMGEEAEIELSASSKTSTKVSGSLRLYYHTATWTDLASVDFPFSIASQAEVGNNVHQPTALENFPNPAFGKTTIRFNLPARTNASVKIYDALGRVVHVVNQSMMSQGAHEFEVNTSGLTAGSYLIELLAPEVGVSEHRSMIVM